MGKQELGEGEFIWPIESAVRRLYGIRQLGASYNHLILRRGNKRKLRGNRADFLGGETRRARAVYAIPYSKSRNLRTNIHVSYVDI